jgi:protocatechuate 3,4-dioxygenase beta subunit
MPIIPILREAQSGRSRKETTMKVATRRAILTGFVAGSALVATSAFPQSRAPAAPTPSCGDDHRPTLSQTEGPFFKPNTPLRNDFVGDAPNGTKIVLSGFVFDAACRPVPAALVELWHADENGHYDNDGFKLRGHQFTDDRGRWQFSTIMPALYPGRTRHYHVKVQRPNGRPLTTQLYFPDEPQNSRDGIFNERLLLKINRETNPLAARFDFVIA